MSAFATTVTTVTTATTTPSPPSPSILCVCCGKSISSLRSLEHFRDRCPQRQHWIEKILPTIPPIVYVMLGFPAGRLNHFSEIHNLIQTHLSTNEKMVEFIRQSYERLITWDQTHHPSSAWMTSGHPLTYTSVFYLLYPTRFPLLLSSSELDDPSGTDDGVSNRISMPVSNSANSVSITSASSWSKKLDIWSRRNHALEQEVQQHFLESFCATKTRDELDQIVWTHESSSSSSRPSRWIGKLWIEWIAKRRRQVNNTSIGRPKLSNIDYLNVNDSDTISVVTTTTGGVDKNSPNAVSGRIRRKDPSYLCVFPDRDAQRCVYDHLCVEGLFHQPFNMEDWLPRVVESFRCAYQSYTTRIHHGFMSSSSSVSHGICVWISDCKRYVLLQSSPEDRICWSINMQYDFLAWWMYVDWTIKDAFAQHNQRQITRWSVPYLVPPRYISGDERRICPYCFRFSSHMMKRTRNCQVSITNVPHPPSTFTVLENLHMIQWARQNYVINSNMMMVTHFQQQNRSHSFSTTCEPWIECLNKLFLPSSSPTPVVFTTQTQTPADETHDWKILNVHPLYDSDKSYKRDKRSKSLTTAFSTKPFVKSRNIIHLLFHLFCQRQQLTALCHVDLLKGTALLQPLSKNDRRRTIELHPKIYSSLQIITQQYM